MKPLQTISLILDLIVAIATVAMFLARPRIGGEFGRGMRILVIGFLVLGVAFVTETLLFLMSRISIEANEIVHRLLIGLGFVLIIWGFGVMRRALK